MWFEYECSIQTLKSWMAAQEERLKRKHRIEDLTSVQNALKDCQVALASHDLNWGFFLLTVHDVIFKTFFYKHQFCLLQEMEELLKEKEKELERVEEQGCALVQNKTDEACAIVMETLQGVNHTWANLDHLVGSLLLSLSTTSNPPIHLVLFFPRWMYPAPPIYCTVPPTDRAANDQPKVGSGSVESVQARLRRNQWLSDGRQVFCVSLPSPHWLPGGCSAAGAKFAGESFSKKLIVLINVIALVSLESYCDIVIFSLFGVSE